MPLIESPRTINEVKTSAVYLLWMSFIVFVVFLVQCQLDDFVYGLGEY